MVGIRLSDWDSVYFHLHPWLLSFGQSPPAQMQLMRSQFSNVSASAVEDDESSRRPAGRKQDTNDLSSRSSSKMLRRGGTCFEH